MPQNGTIYPQRLAGELSPQIPSELWVSSTTVSHACPTLHRELNRLDLHSARLCIKGGSNSTAGAPLGNYTRTIPELPLFSFTHLSASPPCPVLSFHRQPAKPDSQAAYQAFCQPGCLIVLSKHPPAFCLPPPPQKHPGAGIMCCPPPPCHFSPIYPASWLSHSLSRVFCLFLSLLLQVCLTSLFPFGQKIHDLVYIKLFFFFSKQQIALENVSLCGGLL